MERLGVGSGGRGVDSLGCVKVGLELNYKVDDKRCDGGKMACKKGTVLLKHSQSKHS